MLEHITLFEFVAFWLGWILLGIWWLWLEVTHWIQGPLNPLVAVAIITTWPLWLLWRLVGEIKIRINRPRW